MIYLRQIMLRDLAMKFRNKNRAIAKTGRCHFTCLCLKQLPEYSRPLQVTKNMFQSPQATATIQHELVTILINCRFLHYNWEQSRWQRTWPLICLQVLAFYDDPLVKKILLQLSRFLTHQSGKITKRQIQQGFFIIESKLNYKSSIVLLETVIVNSKTSVHVCY